jgi:antitoxin MazE
MNSEVFMQTTVVKWGNSQGIRLPKAFLQNIQISENDPVDVTVEDEKIVIKRINQNIHKTIEQRLVDFYGENYEQCAIPQKEIDWGKPVGDEVW